MYVHSTSEGTQRMHTHTQNWIETWGFVPPLRAWSIACNVCWRASIVLSSSRNCWLEITGYPVRRGWEEYTLARRVKNKLLMGNCGRLLKRDEKKGELLRHHFLSFRTELLLTAGERRLPPTLRFPPLPVCSLLSKQRLYTEKGTFLYFGYELLFLKLQPPNISPYPR